MNLADRVRGVLQPRPVAPLPAPAAADPTGPVGLEEVLGGAWRSNAEGRCLVVERRLPPGCAFGRVSVGEIAASILDNQAWAPILAAGPAKPPFVFIDLETTGLSGGAGTLAFLVGCASIEGDGSLAIRQYVMAAPGEERAMLRAIAADLAAAGALVSFNGKSFDAPVLETRYLFHRLEWPAGATAHLDALHPARLVWGDPAPWRSAPAARDAFARMRQGCGLDVLEGHVLGALRAGDVAGFEIPSRYFQFLRSGDARLLAPVLEHNRLDLLALAGIAGRLLALLAAGPQTAENPQEALALGRLYRRAGLEERAHAAHLTVLELTRRSTAGRSGLLRLAALHALALGERRARRFDAAAVRWQALVDMPDCPPHLARTAAEALAIHHEHRVRDLPVARAFAMKCLGSASAPGWREAVRRRITRLDRKLEQSERTAADGPPVQMRLVPVGPGD